MSLYLCVFDGEEELAGLEVGPYARFNALREWVARELEGGAPGSRFPTLVKHSDCDGEWSPEECARLRRELDQIAAESAGRPGAAEDAEGRPLLDGLRALADEALRRRRPILFQ